MLEVYIFLLCLNNRRNYTLEGGEGEEKIDPNKNY